MDYGHNGGLLAAERPAAGDLQDCAAPLSVGHIDGAARFRGTVDEVRISSVARPDDWVKSQYWSGLTGTLQAN